MKDQNLAHKIIATGNLLKAKTKQPAKASWFDKEEQGKLSLESWTHRLLVLETEIKLRR